MNKKIYVHYGNDRFNPKHGMSMATPYKPSGFWASPVDSSWGWKDWLLSEDYHTETLETSFEFCLKEGTRILQVRKPEDIIPYLKKGENYEIYRRRQRYYAPMAGMELDHEKLVQEFDAMELFLSEGYSLFRNNFIFSIWDVDSIVIWRPECVVPVES